MIATLSGVKGSATETRGTPPHRSRAVAVAIVLFSVYLLTSSGFDATEGLDDLKLADHLWSTSTLGFETSPGGVVAPGRNGRFYVSHDIGNALGFLPAVAVAGVVRRIAGGPVIRRLPERQAAVFGATVLTAAYVAATGAAVFEATSLVFGLGDLAGAATALAFGLGTIAWPYSRSLFDGVLAGLLVAWAYVLLWRYEQGPTGRRIAAAATLLGAAFITRQTVGILVPVAFAFACQVEHGRHGGHAGRVAVIFAAAVAPWAIWQGYYNWLRTGAAWIPATALPVYAGNNALDGNVAVGLFGMLFSPGKSLFLFSPVLIAAVFGVRAFAAQSRAAFVLWLASIAAFLVLHAAIRNWAGEWGWGPRYTVTITPLLVLPLGFVIRRALERSAAVATITLLWMTVAAGVAVQLVAAIINWHYRYAYLFQEGLLTRTREAWTWRSGQFADAFATAARNLTRVVAGAPLPDVVANTHPLNVLASNGINVWWMTAVHAGAPVPLVAALVGGLALCAAAALGWLAVTVDAHDQQRASREQHESL